MSKFKAKPLTAALGAAFLATAIAPAASADVNPFSATPLSTGYDIVNADGHEGKCGEGKCGESKGGEEKGKEGKCGEGKCGGDAKDSSEAKGAHAEGKCGEGKCGS